MPRRLMRWYGNTALVIMALHFLNSACRERERVGDQSDVSAMCSRGRETVQTWLRKERNKTALPLDILTSFMDRSPWKPRRGSNADRRGSLCG